MEAHLLLSKGAVKQPGDDGKVLALVERREEDRVLVPLNRRHCS